MYMEKYESTRNSINLIRNPINLWKSMGFVNFCYCGGGSGSGSGRGG